MPGPRHNLTGHEERSGRYEEALRSLENAASECSMIGGSLDDDGQKAAAEPWESLASEVQGLIARMRKFAR